MFLNVGSVKIIIDKPFVRYYKYSCLWCYYWSWCNLV